MIANSYEHSLSGNVPSSGNDLAPANIGAFQPTPDLEAVLNISNSNKHLRDTIENPTSIDPRLLDLSQNSVGGSESMTEPLLRRDANSRNGLFTLPFIDAPNMNSDVAASFDSILSPDSTSQTSSQGSPSTVSSPIAKQSSYPIKCDWVACGKVFLRKSKFNHHYQNHTKRFRCPACSTECPDSNKLSRHINACHTHIKKYYCSFTGCKRSKLSEAQLNPFFRGDNCRKLMKNVHGIE